MVYYFKNKNMILARLEYNGLIFHITDIVLEDNPLLYMLSSDEALMSWINNRQSVLSRPFVYELFKKADIKTALDFVDVSLCLSITDTFWITKDEKQSWLSVSLFRNRFNKVYTDIVSNIAGLNNFRFINNKYKLNEKRLKLIN